jgi:hypothetical protein
MEQVIPAIGGFIRKLILIFANFILFISSCNSSDKFIDIILLDGQRLQDTEAGWWIKTLNIKYPDNKYMLTELNHEKLLGTRRPYNEYKLNENNIVKIYIMSQEY